VIWRALRFCAWPEPDQIAWTGAIADGDIFDCRGPAAHWAGTTRDAVVAAYGRWFGFLAVSEPSALDDHPMERLTGDRLARYFDHLAETAGTVGRWAHFVHLRDAIRVMFPGKMPQIAARQTG
jgi:hypothetical protein